MKKIFTTILAMFICGLAQAQWNEVGNLLLPEHTKQYGSESAMDKNGNLWLWNYLPVEGGVPENGQHDLCDQRIQCISSQGELLFGAEGMSVAKTSNLSWTMCNQQLMPCSDGSMLVVICDCRDQKGSQLIRTYYAYRLDAQGNHLWNKEGIRINTLFEGTSPAHISMTELPNGNIVFVYEERGAADNISRVGMQCLDKDGNLLYTDEQTYYEETKTLKWPTVVSDEEGGYFVLFGRTDSWYLYVMHFDGEGKPTWDSSMSITRKSTWAGKPMWFLADAMPNGKGEILVYWQDVRDNGPFFPYLACIDKDKNTKFVNATGTADTRVCYSGMSCQGTEALVAPDGQNYYVAFLEESSSSNNRIVVQKVALDSELLFGDKGVIVREEGMTLCQNVHITNGPDNTIAIIWIERNVYNIDKKEIKIQLVNAETGELIGEEPLFSTMPGGEIGNLEVSTNVEGQYWMCYWQDAGIYGDKYYDGLQNQYALRVNFDGSIGNPIIEDGISHHQSADAPQAIYNIMGQRINNAQGLYIVNGKKYFAK